MKVIIITTKIPVNSKYTSADLEKLGIYINKIIENEKGISFYEVTLPKNWSIKELYPNNNYAIIDENNNQRIDCFYNPQKTYLGASSIIKTRFSLHVIDITKRDPRDYYYNEVYFYDHKKKDYL